MDFRGSTGTGGIAAIVYDGYLSDVPSNRSVSPSEVSNDFLQSTNVLEKNFKDKYKVLKLTYEKRLKQMAEAVQESCAALISDELLMEMKTDKTSSAFIPAHITELIERHLDNARERQLGQSIAKVTQLEVELAKCRETMTSQLQKSSRLEAEVARGRRVEMQVEPLQEQIRTMQKHIDEVTHTSVSEIERLNTLTSEQRRERDILTNKLETAIRDLAIVTEECDRLRLEQEVQTKHVSMLEQSFEQSARDLHVIEHMERVDRQAKQELKEALAGVTEERNRLIAEAAEWKNRASIAEADLQRTSVALQTHKQEQAVSERKFSELMQQVESMLAQEARESNAAIALAHEKMKELKHRLTLDTQRERRQCQALQLELQTLRTAHESQTVEVRRLGDELVVTKEALRLECDKTQRLTLRVQEANHTELSCQAKLKEAEFKAKQAEQKLVEFHHLKLQEMKLLETRVQLEAEKSMESERMHLEVRSAAHRLRYQNDLDVSHSQQLHRQSQSQSQSQLQLQPSDVSASYLRTSTSHHVADMERARLSTEYELQLAKARSDLETKYEGTLAQADDHIEQLKRMLRENRSTFDSQQETINGLRKQVDQLRQQSQQQLRRQTRYEGPNSSFVSSPAKGSVEANSYSLNNSQSYGKGPTVSADIEVFASRITQLTIENRSLRDRSETLEADLMRSRQVIEDCKLQAEIDQTADSSRMEDMQKKFDSLMSLYEQQQKHLKQLKQQDKEKELDREREREREQQRRHSAATIADNYNNHDNHYSNSHNGSQQATRTATTVDDFNVSHIGPAAGLHQTQSMISFNGSHPVFSMPPSDHNNRDANNTMDDDLSSSIAAADIYDRLRTLQTSKARLETDLKVQTEQLQRSHDETEQEREKNNALRESLAKCRQTLAAVYSACQTRMNGLKLGLLGVRDAVDAIGPMVALEANRIARQTQLKATECAQRMDDAHNQRATAMRVELTNALEDEKMRLEEAYVSQAKVRITAHQSELEKLQTELIKKADSALLLSDRSRQASAGPATGAAGAVTAHELATKALLDVLVEYRFVSKDTASKVLKAINEHSNTSNSSTSGKPPLFKIIDTVKSIVSADLALLEAQLVDAQKAVSAAAATAVLSEHSFASNHSQGSASLLGELSKLEADSQIATLRSKITELEQKHAVDLAKLKSSNVDVELKLRRSLEEELAMSKAQEFAKISELESRLEDEMNRRLQTQQRHNELEVLHRMTVDEFDRKATGLTQRAEQAELMLAKANMEALFHSVDADSSHEQENVEHVHTLTTSPLIAVPQLSSRAPSVHSALTSNSSSIRSSVDLSEQDRVTSKGAEHK